MNWKINWSKIAASVSLLWKRHGHTALVIGGTGLMIGGGVAACFATTKLNTVNEPLKKDIQQIEEKKLEDNEKKKALTKAYFKAGVGYVKLYGPSVMCELVGATSVLTGHHILNKQHLALASSYSLLSEGFNKYRDSIVKRFGEEVDKDIRTGAETGVIETTEVNEKGKEKVVKQTVKVATGLSDFAAYIDKEFTQFSENAPDGYDWVMVKTQERVLNAQLATNGYLFLNDVRNALGLQPTVAGQSVGWIYDKTYKSGDGHVDLRAQLVYRYDAFGCLVKTLLIDPNVDGDILTRAHSMRLIGD